MAAEIPPDGFSILLSHTPEVYRHAAHAGFDLLLSGHTRGQICLPSSIPINVEADAREACAPWRLLVTAKVQWTAHIYRLCAGAQGLIIDILRSAKCRTFRVARVACRATAMPAI